VAGKVPAWATERLRISGRKQQPVLTVGAGYEDLPTVEQEGALANALVAGDLFWTGRYKTALTFSVPFLAVSWVLMYVAALNGFPASVVMPVFAVLYLFGYLLTFALRTRRIIYRVDHTVAEVLGRSVVDAMIDHDIRNRPLLPGLARLLIAPSPTEAQRAQRLADTFGPRVAG
jgi:hypothetical protein